jgi:hypothetical protein
VSDVAIDWSTADVAVSGSGGHAHLQQSVQVEPEPDSFWRNAFDRLRERRSREVRHDWWVNSPSFKTLTVGGLKDGPEDEVRAELDEMVAQTNAAAERDRHEFKARKQTEAAEAKEREEAARSMTDRFRSSNGS